MYMQFGGAQSASRISGAGICLAAHFDTYMDLQTVFKARSTGGGGLYLYFKIIKCTLKCNTADFTKNVIMLTTEGPGGEVI